MTEERIEVVLKGSRTAEGAVDFDALLAFGDAFRRALRALVRSRSGLPPVQPGQPGAEVREATSLRLIGLRAGSAILVLEPASPRIVADPVLEALRDLVDGVEGRRTLEPPIVGYLRDAVRSLGDHSSVGFRVPGRPPADLDEPRLDALPVPDAVSPASPATGAVDGWLHAVDIDPDEVRIRDTTGREWTCHYPDALETYVRDMIGRVVRVEGSMFVGGPRWRIEVAAITPLGPPSGRPLGLRRSPEDVISDAMSRANVDGPQALAVLSVDIDRKSDEEMAFEAALRAMR